MQAKDKCCFRVKVKVASVASFFFILNQVFLGDVAEELFVEAEVKDIENAFKQDLNKLSTKFAERNKSPKYPYTYLLPEKIPIDINI